MATRTLGQISKQLAQSDQKSRQLLNQQIKSLPGQLAGQKAGLQAQQQNAFGDILSGAKSRGLKFSGIPLAEQAQYTATNFLPALAGLENQVNNQRFALQGSLADIIRNRGNTAQGLYQTELDRDFTAEQNALNRAASQRAAATSAGAQYGSIIEKLKAQIAAFQSGGAGNDDADYQAYLNSLSTPTAGSFGSGLVGSFNNSLKNRQGSTLSNVANFRGGN